MRKTAIMKNNATRYFLLAFSITVIICAVYWQTFFLPFIQDDWSMFELFKANTPTTVLTYIFDINNKIFYRPLAQFYMFILHDLFGVNAAPFHIAAILIHITNSYLIALIINIVTRDWLISYLSAIVYGSAVAIHLEPLAWAVGIYDLGGAFFFFIAIWFFMNNKYLLSAFLYFIGCLFKESIILLPLVLFAYLALIRSTAISENRSKSIYFGLRKIIPFILIMTIFLFIKLLSEISPFKNVSTTHPYVIDLWGYHIIDNTLKYIYWMFQSFLPLAHLSAINIVLPYVILTSLVVYHFWKKHPSQQIIFFLLWILICLSPVIFFPNHTYRYYAIYALPAFIGSFLLLIKYFLLVFNMRQGLVTATLIGISLLAVFESTFCGNKIYLEGLNQKTLADGTNYLIRRAAFVKIIQSGLKAQKPTLPSNSIIFIGDADISSFNKDSGPRVWYNDYTIRVYSLHDLKYKNDRPYISNPIEGQTQHDPDPGSNDNNIFINPSNLFAFKVSSAKLFTVNPEEMKQP